MNLTPEQITENFAKFRTLCEKLGDRSETALHMIDTLGERLAMCPASSKRDYHLAIPGGLVDHSLRVLSNALTLTKSFGWALPRASLIIGCLFHDLGKVGYDVPGTDYYLPGDPWRAEKLGETYQHNRDIQYMTVPARGLWLCQHFGLKLSVDEYMAILLNDGFFPGENKSYILKDPLLSHVVMTADYIATRQEKGEFE
jgi:hypothetical protein